MSENEKKSTHSFQTEARQLLDLMVHSLYSNKEIVLRELISNASDACDKLRFEALTDGDLLADDSELSIKVSFDGAKSWPVRRMVRTGPGNYTWMAAGRPGTPSEGMIYLVSNKDWMARFNLAWILDD